MRDKTIKNIAIHGCT